MLTKHPTSSYKVGDCVIYRKTKYSDHPGPRARRISPTQNGDEYIYLVDKFWVVEEVQADGQIVLRTRRGKQHTISSEDPKLRKARLWERLWFRSRFDAMLQELNKA